MKKINYIWISFVVLALIFAEVTGAQDRWEFWASTNEDSIYFIDMGSIVMVSPHRYLVWEKFYAIGKDREQFFEGSLKGIKDAKKYAYTMSRIEIDCASMKCRTHSFYHYSFEGKVLFGGQLELAEWDDYPPGSIGWNKIEKFCMKPLDAKEM
jgi:hypothetical protein